MEIYFDETEAYSTKEAKVFNDYNYELNENDGAYAKLAEANQLISAIYEDINSIIANYTELQGLYNEFTGFNEVMNANSQGLRKNFDNIKSEFQQLISELNINIEEGEQQDEATMEGLEEISESLNNLDADGTGTDASTTSTPSSTTDGTVTPDANQVDLAAIADDVIHGKYGVGPEREAALAALGVDPAEVQKIVNAKIKGTWTGDENTVVTPTVPVTPDTPVTEDTPYNPDVTTDTPYNPDVTTDTPYNPDVTTDTPVTQDTPVTPVSTQTMSQDAIFNSLGGKDYSHGECGRLARAQLENMGLVVANTSNANGKDYARNLATNAVMANGHQAIGYPSSQGTQESIFDSIVANGGGYASNLVFSFSPAGHYDGSGYGHVVVVSEVKNGRVYLIDNNNLTWSNKGTQKLDISIEEFKQHYLREGNSVNYITQIV